MVLSHLFASVSYERLRSGDTRVRILSGRCRISLSLLRCALTLGGHRPASLQRLLLQEQSNYYLLCCHCSNEWHLGGHGVHQLERTGQLRLRVFRLHLPCGTTGTVCHLSRLPDRDILVGENEQTTRSTLRFGFSHAAKNFHSSRGSQPKSNPLFLTSRQVWQRTFSLL